MPAFIVEKTQKQQPFWKGFIFFCKQTFISFWGKKGVVICRRFFATPLYCSPNYYLTRHFFFRQLLISLSSFKLLLILLLQPYKHVKERHFFCLWCFYVHFWRRRYVVEVPLPYIFDDVMCVFFRQETGSNSRKANNDTFYDLLTSLIGGMRMYGINAKYVYTVLSMIDWFPFKNLPIGNFLEFCNVLFSSKVIKPLFMNPLFTLRHHSMRLTTQYH